MAEAKFSEYSTPLSVFPVSPRDRKRTRGRPIVRSAARRRRKNEVFIKNAKPWDAAVQSYRGSQLPLENTTDNPLTNN